MEQQLRLGQTIERAINVLHGRLWQSQDEYDKARIVLQYRIPVYYGAKQCFGRDVARFICETMKKYDPRSRRLQAKREALDKVVADVDRFLHELDKHEKGENVRIGRLASYMLHFYKH